MSGSQRSSEFRAKEGFPMSRRSQSCPHCNVGFTPPKGGEPGTTCPACGQPLATAAPTPSGAKWYYARNNQSVGPLSATQLRELAATGVLSPTDLVRRSGSPRWVVASKVKGLFARSHPAVPVAAPADAVLSQPVSVLLTHELASRHQVLSEAQVVPDAAHCVQCGICSYNCPIGIDVRAHAWRGRPINDSHCLTCSECVNRCPRGVLSFERIALFTAK